MKEKDIAIKGVDILFNNIDKLINDQKIQSFDLKIYDFKLEQFDLKHSGYIKLIKEIYLTLTDFLGDKKNLFYFKEAKFLVLVSKIKTVKQESSEIIKKLNSHKDLPAETEITSFKSAVVNWPSEAENFDDLIYKLEEKIATQSELNFPLNPNSIIINKKEDYIDKVEKRSTQFYLLAKNKNIEVIRQHIIADKTFQISAGAESSYEMFYILDGTVSSEDKKIVLEAGDSIAVSCGEEERYFETLSDVNLLYISSTPIFASEQKRIQELLSLNEQIADKDNETHDHCDRLQQLSRLTAEEINLGEEKIFNLGYASFLHDIGKAKVPVNLLQKPGKLTESEWKIMKKHAEWGKEILLEQFNNKYFKKIAEIIYQHHERYDGRGYPQGLKGDEISIEAQILSVVDAYDAMVYERPYQRALSREEALAEIKAEKGKQFSPRAVEFFLKAEKKFVR